MMQNMGVIEARIQLSADQVAQILRSSRMVDRHEAMVSRYGEACSKTTAAKIVSTSVNTINAMLEDGRISAACEGERVDVRSLADYIERRSEADRGARMRKKGLKAYV